MVMDGGRDVSQMLTDAGKTTHEWRIVEEELKNPAIIAEKLGRHLKGWRVSAGETYEESGRKLLSMALSQPLRPQDIDGRIKTREYQDEHRQTLTLQIQTALKNEYPQESLKLRYVNQLYAYNNGSLNAVEEPEKLQTGVSVFFTLEIKS